VPAAHRPVVDGAVALGHAMVRFDEDAHLNDAAASKRVGRASRPSPRRRLSPKISPQAEHGLFEVTNMPGALITGGDEAEGEAGRERRPGDFDHRAL